MNSNQAKTLAIQALTFITAEPKYLNEFIAVTGLDPKIIRDNINNDEFLESILDYILSNENLLISYCEAENIDPKSPSIAKSALSDLSSTR